MVFLLKLFGNFVATLLRILVEFILCLPTIIIFPCVYLDGTPPTISNCPGDLAVPTDQSVSTAQVNWTEPTAVDNGQLISLDSDIASGSIFNLGSTVVTYTAVDSVGLVSTCQFNVTVAGKTFVIFAIFWNENHIVLLHPICNKATKLKTIMPTCMGRG